MLQSKADLKNFLAADKYALGINRKKPRIFSLSDEIWKYQIALRKCEYYFNNLKSNIYIYIYIGLMF